MLLLHLGLESLGELLVDPFLVFELLSHLFDRLLHGGKDAVLVGQLSRIRLVILCGILLVLLIRLKDGVLEHLFAYLVAAAEGHRDVEGVLVGVRLGAPSICPLFPVLSGAPRHRVRRLVAIALVPQIAIRPARGRQTHLGQFLLIALIDGTHAFSILLAELLAHTGLILIVHENASLFQSSKLKVHGGLRVKIEQLDELFAVEVHRVCGGAFLELCLVLVDRSMRPVVNVRLQLKDELIVVEDRIDG